MQLLTYGIRVRICLKQSSPSSKLTAFLMALEVAAADNPQLFVGKDRKIEDGCTDQPLRYCICHGEDEGNLMIGCDFCEQWYHPRCLDLTDERVKELENEKWRCPPCEEEKQKYVLFIPQSPAQTPKNQDNEKNRLRIKAKIKSKLKETALNEPLNPVRSLVQQGTLLEVSAEEKSHLRWKSFAFGLKKGTLKLLFNSTLDTLSTKTRTNNIFN